jgi:hypothetical protein
VIALRIVIGLIWVATVILGQGLWSATPITLNDTPPLIYDFPTTAVSASPSSAPLMENPESADPEMPRVDLYGNEIEEAVTDYRVDPGGDLYERHAPDTAVTKLGPAGV